MNFRFYPAIIYLLNNTTLTPYVIHLTRTLHTLRPASELSRSLSFHVHVHALTCSAECWNESPAPKLITGHLFYSRMTCVLTVKGFSAHEILPIKQSKPPSARHPARRHGNILSSGTCESHGCERWIKLGFTAMWERKKKKNAFIHYNLNIFHITEGAEASHVFNPHIRHALFITLNYLS